MEVQKPGTKKWIFECYPIGRSGLRVHKQFEAQAFERHTMDEADAKPRLVE